MAGSKNILVVEDDALIRDLYKSALAEAGFNVEVVDGFDELKVAVEKFKPDFIFLDVMLSGKSGLEILPILRKDKSLNSTTARIVILTNLAQKSVADNAMGNGADGYIIKADILPKDLPKVIESLDQDEEEEL